MQDQSIGDESPRDRCETERKSDNAALAGMFLAKWLWSMEEIAHELGSHAEAEDAVRRLVESGLAHRVGDWAFPTRAARRGVKIEIGT
jgi:hypothetical protein